MENLIFGLFCILAIPLGIGLLIGWLRWGRQGSSRPSPADGRRWLLVEIDREPLRSALTAEQRDEIRSLYGQAAIPSPSGDAAPALIPDEAGVDEGAETLSSGHAADIDRPIITSAPAPDQRPDSPMAAPRPVVPRPARDPLDPAALLLYAGAFLIAAAGVVYAAYNWADLVAWQKLGMLGALTIAFAVVGWLLLGNSRLRQAGETFIAISAMLIPANAIAAWSVVQNRETSTGLIVLVGAAITSVVYGAYSIRPGGSVYTMGAPLLGWLAIGAVPATLGLPWQWGAAVVIGGIGLGRLFVHRLPGVLGHLRQPLIQTGLGAAGVSLLLTPTDDLSDSSWRLPITFGVTTVSLALFASRSSQAGWGIGTTLTGLATVFSGLLVGGVDSPWVLAPLLTVLAIGLVALGERGPEWLQGPPVRLALQTEAVLVGVVAVAAAGDEDWLRLVVIGVGVGLTAWIAFLRQERWVLLLTGAAIVLWAVALVAAIEPEGDWSTGDVVLYCAAWTGIIAGLALGFDGWSRRTARAAWGAPLWVVAGFVAVGTNLVPLTDEDLAMGDRTWLLLAAVNVAFGGVALIASETVRWPGRVAAGAFGVVAAACVAVSFEVTMADRLPIGLLALGFMLLLVRGWDQWRPMVVGRWLTFVAMGIAGLLVVVAMVYLALGYLATTVGLEWADMPGPRWTWIAYAAVFAALTVGAGWLALFSDVWNRDQRRIEAARSVLVGVASGFLLLTTLLVARMLTDDSRALVLTTMGLSWVLCGAATLGSRRIGQAQARSWQRAGMAIAVAAVGLVVVRSVALDGDSRGLLAVSLVSLAGVLATAAWFERNRWLGMAASAVAMVALLVSIATREPESILAYSLPLGLYLLALGTVSRKDAHLRDVLLGAGAGVLLLPVLWLAQDEGSLGYLGLAAGMALVLFLGGIGLRLRVPIAAGVVGVSLIVLRLLLDAVLALQSWVSLLIVGLVLLGAGTAALVWKDALRARLERLQRGWHDLG